jgi:8-oxo-dGTP diphosphatase
MARGHKGSAAMRRFGEPLIAGRRYRARPGVYAILLRGGDLLVTFQAAPQPEIQLPGGGIDPGEQPLAALRREVIEETGWSIAGARRIGAYRRFAYMPEYDLWAEKIAHLYLARPVRRLSPPLEPGHAAFFLPARLAVERLASAGERHFLRRLLDRA